MAYYDAASRALSDGKDLDGLLSMPVVEEISRAKLIPEDEAERFEEIRARILHQLGSPETVE